jgi:DNA-binding NarL/FixJ family response regulator
VWQDDRLSLPLIRQLSGSHPNLPFPLMTGFPGCAPLGLALASGVRGFLVKPATLMEIVEAVDVAVSGGIDVAADPLIRREMRERHPSTAVAAKHARVFQLLRLQHTHVEVAAELELSRKTVEKHVQVIRRKLGLSGKHEHVK